MKYVLYRSFGELDKDVKKHELVGVEFGKDIEEATEALMKAAENDLAGTPGYEHCQVVVHAPEPIQIFRKVKRYDFEMLGVVCPPNASQNILIEFGITEKMN